MDFIRGDRKIFLKFYATNGSLFPDTDDIKWIKNNPQKLKQKHIEEAKKKNLKIRQREKEDNIDTYLQNASFEEIDCKALWKALLEEYDIVEDVVRFVLRKQGKKNKHVLGINLRRKTKGAFDYDDEDKEDEEDNFLSDEILRKTRCSEETIEKIEKKIIERVVWENVRCFRNINNITINCINVNYK